MSFFTDALVESKSGLSPGVAGAGAASSRVSSFAAAALLAIGVFFPCSIFVVVFAPAANLLTGSLAAGAFAADAALTGAAVFATGFAAGLTAAFAPAFTGAALDAPALAGVFAEGVFPPLWA